MPGIWADLMAAGAGLGAGLCATSAYQQWAPSDLLSESRSPLIHCEADWRYLAIRLRNPGPALPHLPSSRLLKKWK